MIELKYLPRSAAQAQVAAQADAAEAQVRRYLADGRLARRHPEAAFKGLALVFRGWELAHGRELTHGRELVHSAEVPAGSTVRSNPEGRDAGLGIPG